MKSDLFKPLSMGKKVERIRKLRDISQDTLARELGMTRQGISKIEQSENIDDDKLDQIASALGVTVEGIKQFSEENALYNVFYDQNNSVNNFQPNNPIDVCMGLVEEIKKLYQQLIQTEREKVELLQKLLDKK